MEDAVCERMLGVNGRMVCLYYIDPSEAFQAIEYDVEVVCPNETWLRLALRRTHTTPRPLKVHVWFDCGLGKEGFIPNKEGLEQLHKLLQYIDKQHGKNNVDLVGIGTKFNKIERIGDKVGCHPDIAKRHLEPQRQVFVNALKELQLKQHPTIHAACSFEVITRYTESYFDMVRIGNLAVYGQDHIESVRIPLRVLDVKMTPPGTCFGYYCEQGRSSEEKQIVYVNRMLSAPCDYYFKEKQLQSINGRTPVNCNPVIIDATGLSIKVGDVIESQFTFNANELCP